MKENYHNAYRAERKYEGGNSDDPHDHGGRTSRGIIQREYDAFRDRKGLTRRDVWEADDSEIEEIYRTQYWDAVRGDDLRSSVDVVVFDGAVNSGPVQSAKWLQRALGVRADGHIGAVTIAAVNNYHDPVELINKIIDQREAFLKHLSTFKYFGKGWLSRTASLRRIAVAMATDNLVPNAPQLDTSAKAPAEQIKVSSPGTSIAVTTASLGLGEAVSQLKDAATQLAPYADQFQFVKYILLGVAMIGFAATAYNIYRNSQIAKVL